MSWPMLTEEHVQIAQLCRNYAETELIPIAAALDKEHRFPAKQVKGLADLGMMGVAISADYGGSG
jgi:butyryl-CoA dehydrogenase